MTHSYAAAHPSRVKRALPRPVPLGSPAVLFAAASALVALLWVALDNIEIGPEGRIVISSSYPSRLLEHAVVVVWPLLGVLAARYRSWPLLALLLTGYIAMASYFGLGIGGRHVLTGVPLLMVALLLTWWGQRKARSEGMRRPSNQPERS